MKEKPRAIGIDDGFFKPKTKGKSKLAAVLMRSDSRLEGILFTEIEIDGNDSTKQIADLLLKHREKFLSQANAVFLSGINFAGFNLADLNKLHSLLKKPIIAVFRKPPKMQKIKKALAHFSDEKEKNALIEKAGEIFQTKNICFQCAGITPKKAEILIKKFSVHSNLPEPIRTAHLIASAATLGKSTQPK